MSDASSSGGQSPRIELNVAGEQAGSRLDAFLAGRLPHLSRSYLKGLIENGRVTLNGRPVRRAAKRLAGGEVLVLQLPPPRPAEVQPQAIDITVIHEDEDIIVVDKPAGLVVHPAPGCPDCTLVNALLHRCHDLSGVGGVLRPGIVHRLDRDTSGVMVVSKSDRAHRRLSEMFKQHQVEKVYLAVAVRRPGAAELPDSGRWDTCFGRHPVHRKRFTSMREDGKQAITEYTVLRRYTINDWQLVQVQARPRTGRTHQIRVHLADHGHPLLGDKLYGGRTTRSLPDRLRPPRQALHAAELAFCHPRSGRMVRFRSPLAADLVTLLENIEALAAAQ